MNPADMSLCLAAGTTTFLASTFVLHRLFRPKFSIAVKCWFCNGSTKVPFGNKNCWDCPHCEQYNGFDEDGGYNKPIPAQYQDFSNQLPSAYRNNFSTKPSSNGFCNECNRNQHLKISAITHFVPLEEDNFDEEINDYKVYLDRVYRLCRHCEVVLRQTLGRQDSYLRPQLLNWRIKRNISRASTKSSSIYHPFIKQISPRWPSFLQFISLLILLFTASHQFYKFYHIENFFKWTNESLPRYAFNFDTVGLKLEPLELLICALVLFVIGIFFKQAKLRFCDGLAIFLLLTTLPLHSSLPLKSTLMEEKHLRYIQPIFCLFTLVLCSCSTFKSNVQQKSVHHPRTSPNPILTRDISTDAWVQNSLILLQKSQVNNGKCKIRPNELNSSLGAMSLGKRKSFHKTSGIFTFQDYQTQNNFYSNLRPSSLQDLRQKRPIISPARLTPQPIFQWTSNGYYTPISSPSWSNRSAYNSPICENGCSSTTVGYGTSTYAGSVYGNDRASLYSEPHFSTRNQVFLNTESPVQGNINRDKCVKQGSEGTNSSRSSSTTCPVDTTTLNLSEASSASGLLFWQKVLLALSVISNVIVITYLLRSYYYHI